jgi:hypothetical protein
MAGEDEEVMRNHCNFEESAIFAFRITSGGLHPHPIGVSLRVALHRFISPNSLGGVHLH